MRTLLAIISFLFVTSPVFSQSNEIYNLAFSDTSNFRILNLLHSKRPKKLRILDTTCQWYSSRFWLENVNLKSPEVLKKIQRDEHHPYHHTYLFKNKELDNLIPDKEKVNLFQKAEQLKSKRIKLKGKNYSTIKSFKNITGFYIATTEPIFSSDNKYAFIDLLVFQKRTLKDELNDTYFGTICIVYEKQKDNSWRKIKVNDYLIL